MWAGVCFHSPSWSSPVQPLWQSCWQVIVSLYCFPSDSEEKPQSCPLPSSCVDIPDSLLRLLWSLLKCFSAHSVSSPALQRFLRRWLPSPTKQNSCSPSFIFRHSICHFLTCSPFVLSLVIFYHRSLHNLKSRFIVVVHEHFGWRENVHTKRGAHSKYRVWQIS